MVKQTLRFEKYSGNGNDFIILNGPITVLTKEVIERLCSRHFGVGADGILVLGLADGVDGSMRIFNADGGEAEMCGNGLRCLVTYLDDHSTSKKDVYRIKTMNNVYLVNRLGNTFAIEMSEVSEIGRYDLSIFNQFEKSFFVNTGVPHLVFLGKDVKRLHMKTTALPYRFHSMFSNGTNVSFVEINSTAEQSAYVRTYERGVEDETHSCGTGLTAVGIALSHWFSWKGDIHLFTKGGEQKISIGEKIYYSGEVTRCFKGEVEI